MSLPDFIRGHHEEIIREFAATRLMPHGAEITDAELRDHADDILTAVVDDMRLRQTPQEQHHKSQGQGAAGFMEASGRIHADNRILCGCPFETVLAEFRALRASVLRLYEESGATDVTEVRRFNEAIDQRTFVRPDNPTVNFYGERRHNDTHQSTTGPQARLYKKAVGHEAKPGYLAHLLTENRHGFIVDTAVTEASGAPPNATPRSTCSANCR